MGFELSRNACVTLRHAISRDLKTFFRGSNGGAAAGSKRNDCKPVPLTFNTLVNEITKRTLRSPTGAIPGALRNKKSLLNRAVQLNGLTPDQPAKLLIGEALEEVIVLLRGMIGPTFSAKAATDTISALRWWRAQADALLPGWQKTANEPICGTARRLRTERQLGKFLRDKIKASGMSTADAAKLSGTPLGTLQGWLKEKRPSRAHLPTLERIAQTLGFPVAEILPFCRRTLKRDLPAAEPSRISEHLKKCRQIKYRLRDDDEHNEVSPALRTDWRRYMEHQLEEDLTYKRSEYTGWRKKECDAYRRHEPDWFESYHGMNVPAASANWHQFEAYLGFLRLDKADGGMGLDLSEVQTLAWAAQPNAARRYLEWHQHRAGENNTGARNFRQMIRSLCAEEVGWLRQQPEMMLRLPERFRGDSWNALCDAVLLLCKAHANKSVTRTRDPFESSRPLLELDEPADPIYDAIEELDFEADSARPGSMSQARALRNAALLALELLVPMRLETVIQLCIGPGGQVRIKDGKLFLDVPTHMLKNGDTSKPLRVDALDSQLVENISKYIELGRPRFVGSDDVKLLFVAGGRFAWTEASKTLVTVTKRLLPQYAPHGICMQNFRHFVASRYLKLFPEQYEGVANLLHDKLQTVLDTYAPPDPTGAFRRNAQGRPKRGAAR
jgi:transcriptional regulator with XRE-family HTH domain